MTIVNSAISEIKEKFNELDEFITNIQNSDSYSVQNNDNNLEISLPNTEEKIILVIIILKILKMVKE